MVASKEMTSLGLSKLDERISLDIAVKYKTVAVVGNSQSLFDSCYGSDIDSHDIVIRFNKAAPLLISNVENSHGSKFDLWAFWTIGAFYKSYIENGPISETLIQDKQRRKIQVSMNGHASLTRDYISHTMPRAMYMNLKN
jgi:hypothetical protein